MSHYSIKFELLLPRALPLRLDVLPFVLIYSVLGYFLYENYEDENLNLYLRLAIIGTSFLHCTHTASIRSNLYLRTLVKKNAVNHSIP